ncbi:MAG: hypothetical protein WBY88_03295, partial [Desulfosarcina sp.]
LLDIFDKSDMPRLFERLGSHFRGSMTSLTSLFRDEQRKVMDTVLETATDEALAVYRQFYDNHVFLLRFVHDSDNPMPKALSTAAQIVINSDLNREFGQPELDVDTIRSLVEDARRTGIALDDDTLEFTLRQNLERMARDLLEQPESPARLARLTAGMELAVELPFFVEFHEIQTDHYQLKQTVYPARRESAQAGDASAGQWVETFGRLAEILKIRMD